MRQGDLLVVGPNLYHRVVNQPNVEVKLVSLNFDPGIIRIGGASAGDEQYLLPFSCQSEHFPREIPRSANVAERALELALQIHGELPANSGLSRLAVMTYLKMLLMLLCKHYSEYLESQKISIASSRTFNGSHRFSSSWSATSAAHSGRRGGPYLAMNSSHFMSFFKRTTGESFIAYLNNFRVAKAQALLSTTNDPLSEISARLAFCSQSYFGKASNAGGHDAARLSGTFRNTLRPQARDRRTAA